MKRFSLLLSLSLLIATMSFAQKRANYVTRLDANYVTEMNQALFAERVCELPTHANAPWNFKGKRPCVIDFYTTWCGPCKRLAPVLEQLAEKYDGIIDFYRVDAEKQATLSTLFNVKAYPTLVFVPVKGQPRMTRGALPASDIEDVIAKYLLTE